MQHQEAVRVWDPLVRILHWTLVVAFFVAYFTGEDAPPLHEWMGYLVLAVVIVRIVWGFAGSKHARFSDFVRGPGEVVQNMKGIVTLSAKRYLGHSPAGGAMVLLLIAMLVATTVTGILGDQEYESGSPIASAMANSDSRDIKDDNGHEQEREEGPLVELHEVLANLTLALVFLHIAGVLIASFSHRENLIASMFTGRKRP